MTDPVTAASEHEFTPDQIEETIAHAVRERDFDVIPGLVKLLAMQVPDRAQKVLDALQGRYTMDLRSREVVPPVTAEDERLAVYEREREELAAAIIKTVNGQYIGRPPSLLTGWQERAVSAVLAAGWLPPAALQERVEAELAEMLAHYSRALDEVYRLRKAMAYEATVLDANLHWKSLPSTARRHMDRQAQRLYQAARGEAEQAYAAVDARAQREALLDAGAEEGLSRGQWEANGA